MKYLQRRLSFIVAQKNPPRPFTLDVSFGRRQSVGRKLDEYTISFIVVVRRTTKFVRSIARPIFTCSSRTVRGRRRTPNRAVESSRVYRSRFSRSTPSPPSSASPCLQIQEKKKRAAINSRKNKKQTNETPKREIFGIYVIVSPNLHASGV